MLEVCGLFIAYFIFVIVVWPALLLPITSFKHYERGLEQMPFWLPSGWVFTLIWLVMFGLVTAAGIIYALTVPSSDVQVSDFYTAITALFIVNITLCHFWTVAFFRMHNAMLALADAVFLFLTASAVAALLAYIGEWLPFGLYVAYPIWLLVALIINGIWVACVEPPRKRCD